MDSPVYTKYHQEYLSQDEFIAVVHTEVWNHCFQNHPTVRERYWNSDEWQKALSDEYNRYSKDCKNETDWDLAINAVMCEFDLMCE